MKRQITTSHSTPIISLGLIILCVFSSVAGAANWSMYRSDPARSGVSPETIGPKLFLHWTYTPLHPPKPAWPMPSEELPRMHNDNAYHVVVADGYAYFGSCTTDKVTSIDVSDGRIRWEFFTEGPVRFAPAVDGGKVFVGSDDGYVYCLDSDDGSLVWRYRAGPTDEKVIGNGRMISLWPVRTGVLVDEGIVYFAAGIFPYEGLYICALKAEDGSVVWMNDTIGDRAHELEYGGISPHGYMLASEDVVYVPSGRAMPAAFDRQTGKFLFYASPGAKRGGTWALLDEDRLISGVDYSGEPHKVAYDARTGKQQGDAFAWFPGMDMTVTRDFSYIVMEQGIYAINRAAHAEAVKKVSQLTENRKAWQTELEALEKKLGSGDETELNRQIAELTKKINHANSEEKRLKGSSFQWRYPGMGLRSIVLAGDVVFTGGEGIVIGIDSKTGDEMWTNKIDGTAVALAASNGYLLVSSDKGPIYCFGKSEVAAAKEISSKMVQNPYPDDLLTQTYNAAAEKILAESQVRKGYALVLDCGEGRLAYELAKRTELEIVGLEKDP
ncbi:MAG: PQQ-binding-like beta-propeller repeat protein, partial [Sedimentisphaerales bacterium]|nr:PQQ-binding-like beta-propeller repeat protein [Sedimentisphaerales bacterium]